jgi:hypothetical protein
MLLHIKEANSDSTDETLNTVITHKLVRDYEFIDIDQDL